MIVQSSVEVRLPGSRALSRLLDIVGERSQHLIQWHWTPETLETIQSGEGADGRPIPSSPSVACERIGAKSADPCDLYLPSRVHRMIQHRVASVLRTMAERDHALRLLVEDGFVRDQHPLVPPAWGRALGRQALRRTRSHPDDDARMLRLTDLQDAPELSPMLSLGAVDGQLASLDADDGLLSLRVKVPTCVRPQSRSDWGWEEFELPIPAHAADRDIEHWHLPTIARKAGVLVARFCVDERVPDPVEPSSICAVVGVDWSPADLGVASFVRERDGALESSFEGFRVDDRGLGEKLMRLQVEGERITAKIQRISKLASRAEGSVSERLEAKIGMLKRERTALGQKRARINRDLAFFAARGIVDWAVDAGAQAIAVEDLATLEAGGHGAENNSRSAQSARRKFADALAHSGAKAGLHLVEVPARGTSSHCPGCDEEVLRPRGYHSAECSCGLSGNRDQMASVNIAKRAIAGRSSIRRKRRSGRLRAEKAVHRPVSASREKIAPTPRRPRHKRVRRADVSAQMPKKAVGRQQNSKSACTSSVWAADQATGEKPPANQPSTALSSSDDSAAFG